MSTSTTLKQHKSRTPSQRDFEIFRLAEIKGLTHREIALTSTTLTRRRISQIVENVRNWLSQHPCEDPQLATELQRKRLGQHMERLRLEDIIERARNELADGRKELTTTTEKADGSKTVTRRQQPFNIQALKTYLRTVEALGKLNQRPEIPLAPPAEGECPWLYSAIDEVTDQWREKVWCLKLQPKHFDDFADDLAAAILKAFSHQQLLDDVLLDDVQRQSP